MRLSAIRDGVKELTQKLSCIRQQSPLKEVSDKAEGAIGMNLDKKHGFTELLTVAGLEATAAKLGRTVYNIGEDLYGCVEADYREVRCTRPAVPIGADQLALFRRKLKLAAAGRAAELLLACSDDLLEPSGPDELCVVVG